MPKYTCNSCGGTYSDTGRDGSVYFHACPPEKVTTPAVFNQGPLITAAVIVGGVTVTPAVYGPPVQVSAEVRTPMANPRNENMRPDLVYLEGKPMIVARDPTDATRRNYTPAETFILAEGAGRTLVSA
jgi:hypothetical protein